MIIFSLPQAKYSSALLIQTLGFPTSNEVLTTTLYVRLFIIQCRQGFQAHLAEWIKQGDCACSLVYQQIHSDMHFLFSSTHECWNLQLCKSLLHLCPRLRGRLYNPRLLVGGLLSLTALVTSKAGESAKCQEWHEQFLWITIKKGPVDEQMKEKLHVIFF